MNSLLMCSLLFLSQIFFFILPSFAHNAITLTLSRTHSSSINPKDYISHIAKSTLQRAYHLKYGKKHPSFKSEVPLFPVSIGGYSVVLSLGTPPQKILAVFDTGSSLVWVPCTARYSCTNCTSSHRTKIRTFKPKLSTSKTHISCHNERCKWLDQPGLMSSCFNCNRSIPGSCSSPCIYGQAYGGGFTVGQASSDNLNFANNKIVHDFFFGCSSNTAQIPEGIAGFGRNPASLPSQLKFSKFSYCLVSHKFDDTTRSSSLILGNTAAVLGTQYTPLLKNPPIDPFNQYYYVQLDAITVNKRLVRIPRRVLVPDPKGNGGSIVDSGSTMTAMIPSLFNPMMEEFMAQLSSAQRKRVELQPSLLGNALCVDVSGDRKMTFLDIVFHFKGGATIDLTVANYVNNGNDVLCLPFVNATVAVGSGGSGPAVIIGNYQQQNYYIEYDLKNERLGLKKQRC